MSPDEIATKFSAELDDRHCFSEAVVPWSEGLVRQRFFIDDRSYPSALLGSARALVFRGRKVVVVRDRNGAEHVQPGGHIEQGETAEQAVRRELLEETGWRVGELAYFGFSFVEFAGPRLGAALPRHGGVHLFFVTEGLSYHRSARDTAQTEVGSSLVPVRRALDQLRAHQAVLLQAAIERRKLRG